MQLYKQINLLERLAASLYFCTCDLFLPVVGTLYFSKFDTPSHSL
jgi:hypothetical protein